MKGIVYFMLVLLSMDLNGQAHDVYLTGNLLDLKGDEGFYQSLKEEFDQSKNEFTLILNGDFVDHIVDPGYTSVQEAIFFQLIDIVAGYEKGKMVILTGDRDWENNGPNGFEAVVKLENKINALIKKKDYQNIFLLSESGCPGPYKIELDVHLLMVAINSQWWNHKYDKPISADAICEFSTNSGIIEEVEDIIDENYNKNILLVAHHPIKSLGNYGGRFSVADHMTPFPIIGTIMNAFRQNVGSKEDLSNSYIKEFIDKLTNTLFFRSNLIMASSHEKNQQIMKSNDNYLVNSGAPGKGGFVARDYTTVLAEKEPGVIKLEYKYDGTINAHFLKLDKKSRSFEATIDKMLYASACLPGQPKENVDENLSYISCQLIEELPRDITTDISKLEIIKAGPQYDLKRFGRFWMGNHYRNEWTTDVGVHYLNVDTSFSGLEALKIGGGRQTTSLKFKSENGDYYSFRSVDKDPSKALSYKYRYTILGQIFKDQTSAQHPYGALVVSPLLDKLGILHVDPKLYLMPDITALGPFQKRYGGMLGMIERNPGKANNSGAYFGDADDILQSHTLFRRMFRNKKHKIEQDEFLRARLFDILVGDWSRHENNWKWAEYDQDSIKLYRPIPRDRDHVFAKWDGVLPSLADREWGLPNTENFDYKIKGFKSLVYQARYMDRFLLTESSKADFIKQAEFIQKNITDSDIELAVKRLPPEVFVISGDIIIAKLKERKKDLILYAEKYHKWLSGEVEILGSRGSDHIEILQQDDGGVRVKIFDDRSHQPGTHLYYDCSFHPDETKQIRIYSLGGDDDFEVDLTDKNKIEIVLIGGRGDDLYRSARPVTDIDIYDHNIADQPEIADNFNIQDHWNNNNYDYDRNRLKFDHYYPIVSLGYSSFDGFTIGGGVNWKKYKWNKRDYSENNQLTGSLSTKGNLGFAYSRKVKEVLGKWDFIAGIKLFNPEFYNAFYGIGNGTVVNEELLTNKYYVTNYNEYSGSVGLSRKFWNKSYFNISTGIKAINNKEVENSILSGQEDLLIGVHKTLTMIPITTSLELDFRDHSIFPKRGIRTVIGNSSYRILNSDNKQLHGLLNAFMEYYTSTYGARPITLGLKVGGGLGYGKVPFHQLPYLGNRSGLRGYSSYRFTGESRVYFNSELRWTLFELDKTLANEVGISVFYDLGRVYDQGTDAVDFDGFHSSYGTGVFITPAIRSFTLSVQLAWSDENSFYPVITLGTALR